MSPLISPVTHPSVLKHKPFLLSHKRGKEWGGNNFPFFLIPFAWPIATSSDRKVRNRKISYSFCNSFRSRHQFNPSKTFWPSQEEKETEEKQTCGDKQQSVEHNKTKGCGKLQDQKWRNVEKSTHVRVPCSQEGFKELVAAAQGCCALGTGAAGDWGQGSWQQGSPIPFWFCFFLPVMWTTSSAGGRRKLMERLWWFAGLYSERSDMPTSKVFLQAGLGEYLRDSLSCSIRLACNVPSRIERDFHHEKTNKQTSSRRKEAVFHILLGGNRRLSYLFWQD